MNILHSMLSKETVDKLLKIDEYSHFSIGKLEHSKKTRKSMQTVRLHAVVTLCQYMN